LALPAAEPGGGTVGLLAGVGYLPYLESKYALLAADPPSELTTTGLIAAAVLPALIARYYNGSGAGSPVLTPEALNASREAAAAAVEWKTDQELGLFYYKYENYDDWPRHADVSLNGWALWLLELAGDGGDDDAHAPLQRAAPVWRAALARQVVRDAVYARRSWLELHKTQPVPEDARYDDWDDLSWLRLTLDADWRTDPEAVKDADLWSHRLARRVHGKAWHPDSEAVHDANITGGSRVLCSENRRG
jgi:hypothetical protein